MLVATAKEFIQGDQLALPLDGGDSAGLLGAMVVEQTRAGLLWQVLCKAWDDYGLGAVIEDEAFKQLVLARIIEPASKSATVGILEDIGVKARHRNSFMAALKRANERGYRGLIQSVCLDYAAAHGDLSLVLYDVTTLYFEAEDEDEEHERKVKRQVGLSKERRVDPQIVVGLLVDRKGNPLRVQAYSGKQAEKKTIIPFVNAFMEETGLADFVIVADAGMLSRENARELDKAGLKFIVGSKQTSAPYDLASYYRWHGNAYTDGQIIDTVTPRHGNAKVNDPNVEAEPVWEATDMKAWRVVWHFTLERWHNDMKGLRKERAKAIDIVEGRRTLKTARFVKKTTKNRGQYLSFDEKIWQRATEVAGLKGYVTNLSADQMPPLELVTSYHDLWHVEQSFRMTKTDLAARPIFHHKEESIEAHLTVVIAALALSRMLRARSGITTKKLVKKLKRLQEAVISLPGGGQVTIPPKIPKKTRPILQAIGVDLTKAS